MSILKAFIYSLLVPTVLVGIVALGGVPAILFVAIFAAFIFAAKCEKAPSVFIKNDGFEYKGWFEACVTIQWSEIASVAFEYADSPDSDSYWHFRLQNGTDRRVTIREADKEILPPAMTRNLDGFDGNYPSLMDKARQESRQQNPKGYVLIPCWERNT
jgi:hypothetical protein